MSSHSPDFYFESLLTHQKLAALLETSSVIKPTCDPFQTCLQNIWSNYFLSSFCIASQQYSPFLSGSLTNGPLSTGAPLPIILHSVVKINFKKLEYDLFITHKSSFKGFCCTQNRVPSAYLSQQGKAWFSPYHQLTPFLSPLVSSIHPNLQYLSSCISLRYFLM